MTVLVVIPARIGSKGIYRKNIKDFAGYPLIAWSIAAAQKATLVDNIIVTTDSVEIKEVAEAYGAPVILRPAWLGDDQTHDIDVFKNVLEHSWNEPPEVLVQLRPTSPIRPYRMVDEAIKALLARQDASSVRSVAPSIQNPFKSWKVEYGRMVNITSPFDSEVSNKPRQILPLTYWQTGHIDVMRTERTIYRGVMSGDIIVPYFTDWRYVADLDNIDQWGKAELRVNEMTFSKPVEYRLNDIVRPKERK